MFQASVRYLTSSVHLSHIYDTAWIGYPHPPL